MIYSNGKEIKDLVINNKSISKAYINNRLVFQKKYYFSFVDDNIKAILNNIISDGSFEKNLWQGAIYSETEKKFGLKSINLIQNSVPNISIIKPIVGHKYYASRWVKSDGNNTGADYRCEIWGGDGYGLNFVLFTNLGYFPDWTFQSTIIDIPAVNAENYIVRCFVINGTNNFYVDGIQLFDLTSAFGQGNEPSKEWCDKYLNCFIGNIEKQNVVVYESQFNNEEEKYIKNGWDKGYWK